VNGSHPGTDPADRNRSFATQIAVAALVVSLVALTLSAIALMTGPTSSGTNASDGSGPVVTLLPTSPDGSATATPSATATTPAPEVSTAYTTQTLTLSPGTGCSGSRDIDLDEPAVGASEKATDLSYRWSCTRGVPGSLTFTGDEVARAPEATTTPQQCLDAIRTAPINTEVTPETDLALCAVTNGVNADGDTGRRLVTLLVITDVGTDSALTVDVTGWVLPS
jgi:hypothetical protein